MTTWLSFPSADTAVTRLMRTHDWSNSLLGDPSSWAATLQTVLSLALHSKTPKLVIWGPKLCMLYNDAYADILGPKHPAALGRPFLEVWPEIRDEVQPLFARAWAGEALQVEDALFTLMRAEVEEKAWFSFSYTPLYEAGDVGGIYVDLAETTIR